MEETNKLRAKLGLKPLEVSAPKKAETGSQEQPVVADVVNPLALRQRQEIRERLAAAKEKRLQNQKLGKVKPLGEGEPWLDDAAAWIERSRQLQREREMAERREKLLEEMDQEFGVSTLVEEEFMRRKRDLYSARDLQGLAVQHHPAAIAEGQTLVLTLKDKGVLEDSEDVLLNPTLAEAEAAARGAELRGRKAAYDPYGEGDGAAQPPPHSLLPQYDEVLAPPQQPTFRLGPHGTAGGGSGAQGQPGGGAAAGGPEVHSLELPPPRLAAEYLSPEEFRKPRRRVRRLRRRERLRADELLHSAPPLRHSDFGSRTRGAAIVFNATSEFCRALGDIPTYGMAGNRADVEMEREERPSPPAAPDSEGEENVGWSSVDIREERQQHQLSAASTTILDEEPIVNRGLAAALLLCQNKGLLETTVQKVARVKAPNKSLPSAVYCIEDKMAIDDKYSRREEFRGFTQDFKEKEGYRPDVKIEYVDETGRKLTPKEAFRQLSHRFHGKGSGKMKTERRMKKLDEEALLKKMSSSDTPLGTVALLQEKQRAQKTPYIVLSGSGKSMNANTITK